ncbi:hypothetical protein [Lactobacillus hokkaidonensis JCM 18461] [Lactiplantibacillus mudanjiangensis]|uniref:tyrosine-protein kinase family protein n=1 Tax=Lactiplantibacillus mudanjiangensis TaxID=1296538 RepID=UPI0010150639|nr:hypothetical protein [Lactobacillus hokkaidonensis JCM 18461] [Lactiplantibacillus mudanjiangensis]
MELKNDQFSREMESIAGRVDLKLKENEQVLAIASLDKGTPKDVLTANLAVNWSRYLKVLVLDLNFGKTPFQSVFDGSDESGSIYDFLISRENAIPRPMQTQFENLYFLPAGENIDNVDLRLQSKRFTQLLEYLRKKFDRVIINGISTDKFDNQIIPLKISDTSVIVISKKFSKKKKISKMAATIQDLKIENLGSVYVY